MFNLVKKIEAPEIESECYQYVHDSGAQLIYVKNDDSNKVFSVSFKTPPYDDTGVFHVLEHCLLNGSKKYDCKEPYNELVKGSLHTYLNASTYWDKTMYPIASYNHKDFINLMQVYLDAVYAPLILEREEIFMQEGFRYALEDGKVKNNGIVYNEMNGAFSNPNALIYDYIARLLFPDTCYQYASGGHPVSIPELTYEKLCNAYKDFYAPSNSYIYLYGDMDFDKCVKLIEPYLKGKTEKNHEIKLQKPIAAPIISETHYQNTGTDNLERENYLVAAYVVGTTEKMKTVLGFNILNYILLQNQSSPLKNALKHISHEITAAYGADMRQPLFVIKAKNTKCDAEEFRNIIRKTLAELVEKGIDGKLIESAISKAEFSCREADYGRFPKGLIYNVSIMPNWMSIGDPFAAFNKLKIIDEIKNSENYFENLIKEYFLDNGHCCYVAFKGSREPLYKETELVNPTAERLKAIENKNKALETYQKTPDTKEQLNKIPRLSKSDISKKAEPDAFEVNGNALITNIKTNDIVYANFIFNAKGVSTELLGYIRILCYCIGKMDTADYKYNDLSNELDTLLGGYSLSFEAEPYPRLSVKIKVLKSNMEKAKKLIIETIQNVLFEDKERLLFLLRELKSALDREIVTDGNVYAVRRAKSYFDLESGYIEKVYGADFYFFLKGILEDFDNKFESIKNNINKLIKLIFTRENLFIAVNENLGFENFTNAINSARPTEETFKCDNMYEREAFIIASQVQYAAKAADYRKYAVYSGEMAVLAMAIKNGHLMTELRIKGGAYGCGCVIERNGVISMFSYRDPNIAKTLNAFDESAGSIGSITEDDLERFALGAINSLDCPLTPKIEHERAVCRYLKGITYADRQKERDEILSATTSSLRKYTEMLTSAMAENKICVFGSESKINEDSDIFQKIYII